MHGNKKLCRIFLGKCIGAPYEILTTKKPPSFATRGLFVWLKITLWFQQVLQELGRLALLQFALAPDP